MPRITWFSILLCFASAQNETLLSLQAKDLAHFIYRPHTESEIAPYFQQFDEDETVIPQNLLANDNVLDQIGFESILPGVNDDSDLQSFVANPHTSQEPLHGINSLSFGRDTTSRGSNSRNADEELPGTSGHGKSNIYGRKQCRQTYENRQSFSYHQDKHEPRFQCSNCTKSFKNLCSLRRHEHMDHVTPYRHYDCTYPECNEHFVNLSAYKAHRAIHKEPFLYECKQPGCKKTFKTSASHSNHQRTHLPRTLCTMCGNFFQQRSMKNHMENCRRALEHGTDTSKDLTQLNAQIGHSSRRDEGPGTSSVTSQNEWVNTDFPEYFHVPDDFHHVLSSIGRKEN